MEMRLRKEKARHRVERFQQLGRKAEAKVKGTIGHCKMERQLYVHHIHISCFRSDMIPVPFEYSRIIQAAEITISCYDMRDHISHSHHSAIIHISATKRRISSHGSWVI